MIVNLYSVLFARRVYFMQLRPSISFLPKWVHKTPAEPRLQAAVACMLESGSTRLAQSRLEVQKVQTYVGYLQGHFRSLRHILATCDSQATIGILDRIWARNTSSLEIAKLRALLDRVDAQGGKVQLSLMAEAMALLEQDERLRAFWYHFTQVHPHTPQCDQDVIESPGSVARV